ncbi:MAG: sodium:solute symporter family protein, partial [Bacteroidota bacterium]
MNALSTDHLIVYTFLAITLIVGLWAGRGIKDIREYAIANKQFGTGALTLTLIATYIGGWHLFGFPSDVFADGLIYIIPDVGCAVIVCLLFIAWFIAPKVVYFKGCLTMGDLMNTFYGQYGQVITGYLGLIYNTTAVSVQIFFLSYVCGLLGINSDWGLSLAALVLAMYTAKGGIRAVTATDILQFTAIVAAIPLLAHLMTYQAGGMRALLNSVPQEKLQLFGQDKTGAFSAGYYTLPIATLWYLFPGFPLSFPFIQRMLMARDQRQSVNMYYLSLAFLIPFFLLLILIGLAALVVYPQINSQDVLPHIVSHLPVGLKGLVWTALLAVIMSTTDSFLHAAGVSLTHDLIKPLLKQRGIAIDELKVVQYATFLIACLAIVVVLAVRDIFKIAMYGMDLAALLFTIPLMAGIMGLKTEARSFLTSLLATLTAFTITKLYLGEELVIPICILVNAVSFFGTHYLLNQGFAVVTRSGGQQESYVWHPSWEESSKKIAGLLPKPQKLLHYSQNRVAKYGANPTLFALFVTIGYMVPLLMHSYAAPAAYNWLLGIRGVGTLLCVGLLLKSQWPSWLLPYFSTYYHFSLLYCLPFVTTFLFLLEGGSIEWLLNVSLAIILLIVLADWATFVWLSTFGVALAMGLYRLGIGPLAMRLDLDTTYTLAYAITFSTLIGLLFARRRQQRAEQQHRTLQAREQASQAQLSQSAALQAKTLKALEEASTQKLLQVVRSLQTLPARGEATDRLQATITTLVPIAFQLQGINIKATDYLRLQSKPIVIDQWLKELRDQFREYNIGQSIRFI